MKSKHQLDQEAIALDFINHTDRNIFLTGGAGTGKTTFLKFLRKNTHKKIVVLAPTGVAALNAGGVTIHSLFGLPARPLDIKTIQNIRPTGQLKLLLRELELLVIDEVSTLRADVLDAMSYLLKDARLDSRPFGGIQIVFIGDLFQLPPVETTQDTAVLKGAYQSLYFTAARAFEEVNILQIQLTRVYRQLDPIFVDLLNAVRTGLLSESDLKILNDRQISNWHIEDAIVLTTHNRYASAINDKRLDRLPGIVHTFIAEIAGDFSSELFPVDNELKLKIGCRVMVTKNDHSENRQFFSGKIGIVTEIDEEVIIVRFDDGIVSNFQRESWPNISYTAHEVNGPVREIIIGTFKQFPLKPAWAITVHKSQGLTFEKAVIDVGDAFAPGQVYVALSRVRSLDGLYLKSKIPLAAIITPAVQNMLSSDNGDNTIELNESKKSYMSNFFAKKFQWDQSAIAVNENGFINKTLQSVYASSVKLNTYILRFLDEIAEYIRSENWETLTGRVAGAKEYFAREIQNTCIDPLKNEIRIYKGDLKFRAEVNHMKDCVKHFQNAILSITMANTVAKIVAEGISYKPLHAETASPRGVGSAKAEEKTLSNPQTISTEAQSLQLFLEGKTVAEIASTRMLGVPAVQAHLASYIPSGQVSLVDIISANLLKELLPIVEKMKSPSVAELRILLGGKLSIGQYKALSIHLRSLK